MPKNKNLQKTLQDCLSKIKKQTPSLQFSPSSKIFSGCKHPKSLSLSFDHNEGKDVAATLEDIDRFERENFPSFFSQKSDQNSDDSHELTHERKTEKAHKHKESTKYWTLEKVELFDSPVMFTPPPDLCNSQRFFISPTFSGSLLDIGSTSASTGDPQGDREHDSAILEGVEDCIAVLTVSRNPYEDYRRSMQQVIEARVQHKQSVDWDFMEELLFCYLRLNEKKQYRYILSAYIDLVVTLRQISSQEEGSDTSDNLHINGN